MLKCSSESSDLGETIDRGMMCTGNDSVDCELFISEESLTSEEPRTSESEEMSEHASKSEQMSFLTTLNVDERLKFANIVYIVYQAGSLAYII